MDPYPESNKPVIIGIGQCVHRPENLSEVKRPLDLIEMAIHKAERDSGIRDLAQKIDNLCLVNILSWPYDDPVSELSSRIDADPKQSAYTWVGATAPQWFVNRTAEKLFDGQSQLVLICGGEAFYSSKFEAKAKNSDFQLWNIPPKMDWMKGDKRDPLTSLELKYGLMFPINIYPLFENALRYHESLSIEEHQKDLGKFCSEFSSIAAGNQYAWFRESKTVEDILEVSELNRMISFPYTKAMCSMMVVDQSAAVFLTNIKTARELGIPEEKWIFPLGSGDASDIWHISQRQNYYASPSAQVAADKAMEQAGVSLPEIDYFDFYSCFPSATRVVRNTLGISKTDPRPLTITGGMPYFGGPGNNYSLHSICKMVELIRQNPSRIGMVHSLSWFINKHSIGIYSGISNKNQWHPLLPESYQKKLDKLKGPELVEEASGKAIVETYTVFHDREGMPANAVAIGRTDDKKRFLAKIDTGPEGLNSIMEQEFIGTKGKVLVRDGFNIFQY